MTCYVRLFQVRSCYNVLGQIMNGQVMLCQDSSG